MAIKFQFLYACIAAAVLLNSAGAAPSRLQRRLDNGLALTPPMGWNSYNHYSCSPNESIIVSNAQAVVDLGLDKLGYHYVTTDCGWTIPERTSNGTLTWNATLFPNGFEYLGQFIHGLGLGFGVYSDGGIQMCMTGGVNQTGSLGYETVDADTFSGWGADLLKYDNCYSEAAHDYPNADYNPVVSPKARYTTMQQALNGTGREILYQICDWGVDFPSAWAPALGNTWRVTNDILPSWRTIYRILNQVVPQTSYAGPGHWLDLDMLEIGNKVFTIPEEQTHFSLWAMLKSPLVIGTALNDTLTSIAPESLAILANEDVIGYDQDSLGVAANLTRRWTEGGYDVWVGPLSGGRTIAALINWNNKSIEARLDLPDVGLQSAGSVKEVWTNKTTSSVLTSYSGTVEAHGVMLLEFANTTPAGTYSVSVFGTVSGTTLNVSNIYGITSSSGYTMTITLSAAANQDEVFTLATSATQSTTEVTIPQGQTKVQTTVTLSASNANSISINPNRSSALPISSVTIQPPAGEFYASSLFTTYGVANHVTCSPGLCAPVGSKIANLSADAGAQLSVPRQASSSPRYVELTYINNDVAFNTSWTDGRNARNITIRINDADPVRLEVPISGRSSELFSPMNGWGDPATLGLLVSGWQAGSASDGNDTVVIANEGGGEFVQPWGADFVGMRIY